MSADNPTSTTADKPVPPAPAPAETDDGADVYDPDPDELADEALSEPPINYDADPVSTPAAARDAGENHGSTLAASGSADGEGGAAQDGYGGTGTTGPRDQGGPQVPVSEGAGSLEQPVNAPGAGGEDAYADVYDPDLDALADEALSEPPIDYNEDPAPVRAPAAAPVYDSSYGYGTAESGSGESGTESGASERPGRGNGQQQDSQPAPVRGSQGGDTDPRAEDDANGKPDSDPAAKADTPAPPSASDVSSSAEAADQDPAQPADAATTDAATSDVPEPTMVTSPPAGTETVAGADSGHDTADAALTAATTEDTPVTSATGSDGELSGEAEPASAERPEDPAASLIASEAVAQEPGSAEPDENAQPGNPLAAVTAEPGTGGDIEPAETTATEADPAQTGTMEHDPQTQDPEPEPEAVLALDGDGAPETVDTAPGVGDADNAVRGAFGDAPGNVSTALGNADSGGSGPKPRDSSGPGDDIGPQGAKNLVLHWKGEFHGEETEFYSDLAGKEWASAAAVEAKKKEKGKSREGVSRGVSGLPQERDLGDNEVGENPEVHLGDLADDRTFGEKMMGEGSFGEARRKEAEEENSASRKAGRALDAMMERGDDLHDAVGNETETANDFFMRGTGPTNADLPQHPGGPAYVPVHSQGINAGDAVGGTVILTAAALTGIRHIINSHRKEREHE